MKHFPGSISALSLAALLFVFAACGSDTDGAAEQQQVQAQDQLQQEQTIEAAAVQAEQPQQAAQSEETAQTDQTAAAQQQAAAAEQQAQTEAESEGQQADGAEQTDDEMQAAPEQQSTEEEPPPILSPTAQAAADWTEQELQLRAEEIAASAEVSDLVEANSWLSGEATTIARELAKGNIVLIDFWTYTCVNCVRTLPFLVEWHEKYGDRGLTIIGVHTPEFEFEKVPANVSEAIEQYGIEYHVVQDNDYRTWRAYSNRYWPAKYLIGPSMEIRYQHFGEGDYLETEQEIRKALIEAEWDLTGIEEGTTAVAPQRDPTAEGQTRELYGGTRRNYGRTQYAAQPEYYLEAGTAQLYSDPAASVEERGHNLWYLEGLWRNEEEAIVHARETENLEDYLALRFVARAVNVVLTLEEDAEPFNVFIEMDGRWLLPTEAGADIRWDAEGRSFVRVTRNDLYRLVVLPVWSEHELKLRSNSDRLAIFAFTFGSYLGGE